MEWEKSQRYQAAVDGHLSRRSHWGNLRRLRQQGVQSRNTNLCFYAQTLGDGLSYGIGVFMSPFWGHFFVLGGKELKQDAFSRFHPAVNFLFFMGAIGFGVVLQHPAYMAASILCGAVYYLLLKGRKAWKLILGTIPMFLLIVVINPLVNHRGRTVLWYVFGNPYTLESVCYGAVLGCMFVQIGRAHV